jgi:hypothetical protein
MIDLLVTSVPERSQIEHKRATMTVMIRSNER